MKDLSDVIEWIELGNQTLFSSSHVKMTLYLFENSYQEVQGGSFKQRRRSLPLEAPVFEAFPDLFKKLVRFVQLKLLNKKSEIRFGIVIRSTSQAQRIRMQDRIKKIASSMPNESSSVIGALYNSDDDSANEYKSEPLNLKQIMRPNEGGLNNLNRQAELSDSLLSESQMEESTLMVHGNKKEKTVKIMDKSKRAYDTSMESTRALELAIQKDVRQCSNTCTRLKSVFYSTWLLMFKAHGRAPTTNLNFWFLCYSITFSVEILLNFVFILHIANPVSNVWGFGFPFLFIMPGIPIIAPLWGLLAILFGSAQMLKSYSTMNSTMLALNYPLTLMYLLFAGESLVYTTVICFLILNKVTLSFFGSKVR